VSTRLTSRIAALVCALGIVSGAAFAQDSTPLGDDTDAALLTPASDLTYYVSGFAGVLTDQDYHEIALDPIDIEFRDSQLVGFAGGFERPTRWNNITIGAEAQIVRWFGDQEHWELNAMPLVGRYHFDGGVGILRSLSFGLGFSYASELPLEEVDRAGESNRFLVYWAAEAEFGRPDAKVTPFFLLHHRSNAFGLIEENGGANSLAVGLRRRF